MITIGVYKDEEEIKVINENVYKDLDNTIINFNTKVDVNSEIMLLILADFEEIASDFNNFYQR